MIKFILYLGKWRVFMEKQSYSNKKDTFGLWAAITGVLGILSSLYIFTGFLLGIAAITLGALSRIHYEKFNNKNVIGITFGISALFLSAVFLLSYIALLQEPEVLAELQRMIDDMMKIYYAQ